MSNTDTDESVRSDPDNADLTLFTVAQVASMCVVTQETVRAWIEDEKIDAIKVNRQWRIRRTALATFLNKRYGEKKD